MARLSGIHPNLAAFLDMIAWAEGTSTSKVTHDDGYDVIVSGVDGAHNFTDYASHPFANGRHPIVVSNSGLKSTASGRYQFLGRYWDHYRVALKLPDFGPDSQDRWAIQLIRERQAISDVKNGDFLDAVHKCSSIWASLPGNRYGQPQHGIAKLMRKYIEFGGRVA